MRIPLRHFDGKTITEVYDELYARADEIIKKYNPCRFSNGECAGDENCCAGCRHLSMNGCSVKALACKLWLCWDIKGLFPECERELLEVKRIAIHFDFVDSSNDTGYRESKHEALRRLSAPASMSQAYWYV